MTLSLGCAEIRFLGSSRVVRSFSRCVSGWVRKWVVRTRHAGLPPAVVFRRQPFGRRLPRAFEHFDGLEVRLGNSNYYCRVRVRVRVRIGGGASAWSKAVCSWGRHRQLLSEFGQVEYA